MSMAFYAQADVKIGVAGPFTGPNATYGAQYWKGASQAVADINAAGGILGRKIKVIKEAWWILSDPGRRATYDASLVPTQPERVPATVLAARGPRQGMLSRLP